MSISSGDLAWTVLQPLLQQIPDKLEAKLIEAANTGSWLPDNIRPMDLHGHTAQTFAMFRFVEAYTRSYSTITGNIAEDFLSGVMQNLAGHTKAINFHKIVGANDYQFILGNHTSLLELTQNRKTKNASGKKLSELQKQVPKTRRYTMYISEEDYISPDRQKFDRRRACQLLMGPEHRETLDCWTRRDTTTHEQIRSLINDYQPAILETLIKYGKEQLNLY